MILKQSGGKAPRAKGKVLEPFVLLLVALCSWHLAPCARHEFQFS